MNICIEHLDGVVNWKNKHHNASITTTNLITLASTFVKFEGRSFINNFPVFSHLYQQSLELELECFLFNGC